MAPSLIGLLLVARQLRLTPRDYGKANTLTASASAAVFRLEHRLGAPLHMILGAACVRRYKRSIEDYDILNTNKRHIKALPCLVI